MRTDPPLVWRRSVFPPLPSVPERLPRSISPRTASGRSVLTALPEASIDRSAPGSIETSMPPPELESEPPRELPLAKLASMPPPEVSALIRPPASTIPIPPPEVSASMSPETRSSSIEPPELVALTDPVMLVASTPRRTCRHGRCPECRAG